MVQLSRVPPHPASVGCRRSTYSISLSRVPMKPLFLSELLPWGGAGGCQEPSQGLFPWDVPRGHCTHGCTHAVVAPAQQLLLSLSSRRELNVEPLKIFLFQNIFCISCNRYYNDSVHLLKIYDFRLLLVITNSCYIQVVINMSDVQLKSLFFNITGSLWYQDY